MPPLMQHAITITRRASWVCALIAGAWVAWAVLPLNVPKLLVRTGALQYSYADIYSELHEQPFGWCDSYYPQREEALKLVQVRANELDQSSPLAVVTLMRDYDATMSAHYEEDCRVAWHPYQNPANFQKVFTQDYPLYYLIASLRLTEVRLALLQVLAGWLGFVAIALLSVYFWRSPLAPFVALALSSWLGRQTFVKILIAALPGISSVGVVRPEFMYPAVTIVLIIAMLHPIVRRTEGQTARWITVALAIAYCLHTFLYYVVDPPVARTFALIGLVYVGGVGLAYRRRQVVAVAVLAAGLQFAADYVFRRPGLEIYSAVTMTNHLASEAYTAIMMYMGFFERPSPFGLFYMDEVFGWIVNQDPVLVRAAPFMAVHHSYAHVGSAMVWQAFTREPLMVIDAVFRRLLIQVFYRQLWVFWTLKVDWIYTWTLLSVFVVNACAWRRRGLFLAITPITLCLLVNQFAVNTVMTMVHTHSRWNIVGVMLMFAVAPLYVFVAVRLLWSTPRRWPDWRVMRSHPAAVAGVALAVAASLWFAAFAIRTTKQEREYVRIWMSIHQPPPTGLDILAVTDKLESMRASTGDPRGEIAMWIVTIARMYEGRAMVMTPELRVRLDEIRHRDYRQALEVAPDNPHYLYAAWFLQIDGWESYLLDALKRFPDAVYAPGAAAALHYYGKGLPDATRESVARRYEVLTSQFLASGRSRLPGFQEIPRVAQTIGEVAAKSAEHRYSRPALQLTMSPGAVVFLSDTPTYGSQGTRVFAYVDLQDGNVELAMTFGGEGRERTPAPTTWRLITKESQRLAGRYHFFEAAAVQPATTFGLWLKAGAQGATVEVRDFYPIVDTPSHYYRSGLMERLRKRARRAEIRHPS